MVWYPPYTTGHGGVYQSLARCKLYCGMATASRTIGRERECVRVSVVCVMVVCPRSRSTTAKAEHQQGPFFGLLSRLAWGKMRILDDSG